MAEGLGPFAPFPDMVTDFFATLDSYEIDQHPLYRIGVMVPEAIIYGYMTAKGCSKDVAEFLFLESSKKVQLN